MAKFLSRDEERRLIIQAQQGDIAARNRLVEQNLGLIYKLIRPICRRYGVDVEEMLGVAAEQFLGAIQRFDVGRPNRLSSMAAPMMLNHVKRAAYSHGGSIRIPSGYCSPSIHGKLTSKTKSEVKLAGNVVSLSDKVRSESETLTLADGIEARDGYYDDGPDEDSLLAIRRIEEAIGKLPEKQQQIVRLRTQYTLRETGDLVGLSSERVRQIHNMAVRRIREIMRIK